MRWGVLLVVLCAASDSISFETQKGQEFLFFLFLLFLIAGVTLGRVLVCALIIMTVTMLVMSIAAHRPHQYIKTKEHREANQNHESDGRLLRRMAVFAVVVVVISRLIGVCVRQSVKKYIAKQTASCQGLPYRQHCVLTLCRAIVAAKVGRKE